MKTIWKPDQNRLTSPKYLSIARALEDDIETGRLVEGDRLPPQRELAFQLGVTLGTITRAYAEAERKKLVRGETGRGTYVAKRSQSHAPLMLMPTEDGIQSYDLARNLGLAHLNPDLGPMLREIAAAPQVNALNEYGPSEGSMQHREIGAQFLKEHYAAPANPAQTLITCGAQHAIQLAFQTMFNAGDAIAVDAMVYPPILSLLPGLGLHIIPIEPAHNGRGGSACMTAQALEDACKKHNVRGVFLIPNTQNPTTASMPDKERQKLARVAEKFGLTIIEDDPYTPFLTKHHTSFLELLPEQTVLIGSPSKVMSPGMRVGYLHTPQSSRVAFANAIGESTWMASPLNVEIVSRWIANGTLQTTLQHKREVLQQRFTLLKSQFSEFAVEGGEEKMFAWLNLPDHIKAEQVEQHALLRGAEVLSHRHFQASSRTQVNALRVSLSTIRQHENFEEALQALLASIHHVAQLQPSRPMMG